MFFKEGDSIGKREELLVRTDEGSNGRCAGGRFELLEHPPWTIITAPRGTPQEELSSFVDHSSGPQCWHSGFIARSLLGSTSNTEKVLTLLTDNH